MASVTEKNTNVSTTAFSNSKTHRKKKSVTREWLDAIVFAVIAATIIRTFFIEAYVIPTGSMEKSLLIGDFLFVSKINYGPRIPITPVAFPFAHNSMPLGITPYWDGIQLPYHRLPGFEKIKRYDVVVFNWPGDSVNHRPVDKKENYIKRCQGLPGDTLQIVNRQVFINGKPSENAPESQTSYQITTDGTPFNPKTMEGLGIRDSDIAAEDSIHYFTTLTANNKEKLGTFSTVKSVTAVLSAPGQLEQGIFGGDSLHKWNLDNYGPLFIPGKGLTVKIDPSNINVYGRAIGLYEHNTLAVKPDGIYINGVKTGTYTFKMNYYFMMGDNRHNSLDSRYWGFVPEDHVVGKALFVWMSWNNDGNFLDKIRWNRLFKGIK